MRVAVVILNWNGKSFLQKYLPSVLNTTDGRADVIIADNGSTDGSFEFVAELCTQSGERAPLWIPLEYNRGFCGGYNLAFSLLEEKREKEGLPQWDYYVLLNSDVLTPENWIDPIIAFMDAHPEVGVCQPKILSLSRHEQLPDGEKEWFEYAGACGGFIDRFGFPFCRGRILSCIEEDNFQYDTPIRTFWASGACMAVRSELWHKLGGLEEQFFAHMEEIDFCWRAAHAGWQIWCIPQSKIYHIGGGTLPNNSPLKLYYNYRNSLLMLWRNLPRRYKGIKILRRMCIDALTTLAYAVQFKFSFAGAVFKAHRDFLRMKKNIAVQDVSRNDVYGIYRHSIILKFFTGHKKFSRIKSMQENLL